MRRSSSSCVQSGGSESITPWKSSASGTGGRLPAGLHAHGARELVAERVVAPVGAHGEGAAERLAPDELELVARRDAELREVAQHVGVRVGHAREDAAFTGPELRQRARGRLVDLAVAR